MEPTTAVSLTQSTEWSSPTARGKVDPATTFTSLLPPSAANDAIKENLEHGQTPTRIRRKRVAIEIPEELLKNGQMDAKEVKRLKNRIAAARLRERSQQKIQHLEEMVQYYKDRMEYLESVIGNCAHCSNYVQLPPELQQQLQQQQAPSSPDCSTCYSPSSPSDEDWNDVEMVLDDLDCDLIHDLLQQS